MDDMISRQAAINAINEICDRCGEGKKYNGVMCGACYMDGAVDCIEALPPTEPKTAKRIVGKSRNGMTLWYQCDMCNEPVDAQDNFCRGCGRRLTDG